MSNCGCSNNIKNLSEPKCVDYLESQPRHVSMMDGKYYEDGDFVGDIIDMDENKKDSSVTVKYKAVSSNRYINGTVKTVTFKVK